jgi:hypothetical protein
MTKEFQFEITFSCFGEMTISCIQSFYEDGTATKKERKKKEFPSGIYYTQVKDNHMAVQQLFKPIFLIK